MKGFIYAIIFFVIWGVLTYAIDVMIDLTRTTAILSNCVIIFIAVVVTYWIKQTIKRW